MSDSRGFTLWRAASRRSQAVGSVPGGWSGGKSGRVADRAAYRVERYSIEPLARDAVVDGNINNLEAVAEAVMETQAHARIEDHQAYLAIEAPDELEIDVEIDPRQKVAWKLQILAAVDLARFLAGCLRLSAQRGPCRPGDLSMQASFICNVGRIGTHLAHSFQS